MGLIGQAFPNCFLGRVRFTRDCCYRSDRLRNPARKSSHVSWYTLHIVLPPVARADPTGLVSLGIEGIGALVRVRKRWKERHKVIKNLAEAVDRADLILRRDAHRESEAPVRETLVPLIERAITLLDRFARQKRSVAVIRSILPEDDLAAAQNLVDAFKDLTAEAEARRLTSTMACIQNDIRAVKDERLPLAVAECKKMAVASSFLSMSFFFRGKPA